MASFIKTFDSPRGPGGLFGSWRGTHELGLDWTREQQAAFLIMTWHQLREAVRRTKAKWAVNLRERMKQDEYEDEEAVELAPFRVPTHFSPPIRGVEGHSSS